MTLIFDRRAELGDQPGTHVLIVGVSAYRHLHKDDETGTTAIPSLRQLNSAALTAESIARWLIDHQDILKRKTL